MKIGYYPFGMLMPGRSYTAVNSYRYGFNGKEKDNEVKGEGNQQDYGMRIYDPRLGRFLSVDPLTKDYPELTPYQFASNTPIIAIDIDGLEAGFHAIQTGTKYEDAKLAVEAANGDKQAGKTLQMLVHGQAKLAGATLALSGGVMAAPTVANLIGGIAVWSSQPANQQRAVDGFNFLAELLNPDPAPLNPGNPGSQLGEDVKQVTKRLFTSIGPIFQRRKELAKLWGIAEKYIEFSKKVYKTELKEGTDLIQYRVKGTEGTIGNYYALPGTKPESIGIKPDDVVETLNLKVDVPTTVLISTHKQNVPYYKDGTTNLKGGGVQIFSTELKNNVIKIK